MKIRLIQPPLVQPMYRQLTLPVVGAELAAQGLEVEACDENVEPLDLSDADLVGITCHVYNAPRAFEIARSFRERGIPVIFGGTFPTVAPELVAPHCDSVVVGELEGQAERLVRDAKQGRLAPLYRSEQPPPLERTRAPDWSLLDSSKYFRFNFPLEVSRGCRFACRFCTAKALFGKVRARSLQDIERDLSLYDHGLVEVVDVNFLSDAAAFRRVLPILERASIPGWTGQTSVLDLAADPEWPELLARSRCKAVFVGVESASAEGLRSVDKGWSKPEVFLDVARRLREAGVLVQAGIIVGLDGDDEGTLRRTGDLLEEARVQSMIASHLHYYPGTPPFAEMERQGRLCSTDWRDYDGNRRVLRPLRMPEEAFDREVERLVRRFYGLRSTLKRGAHAGMLRQPSQLVHHLVQNVAMGSYFEEAEGAGQGPAKRYMGGTPAPSKLERAAADAGSWLLEKIWK